MDVLQGTLDMLIPGHTSSGALRHRAADRAGNPPEIRGNRRESKRNLCLSGAPPACKSKAGLKIGMEALREGQQRAKYYCLSTHQGEKQLAAEQGKWAAIRQGHWPRDAAGLRDNFCHGTIGSTRR